MDLYLRQLLVMRKVGLSFRNKCFTLLHLSLCKAHMNNATTSATEICPLFLLIWFNEKPFE